MLKRTSLLCAVAACLAVFSAACDEESPSNGTPNGGDDTSVGTDLGVDSTGGTDTVTGTDGTGGTDTVTGTDTTVTPECDPECTGNTECRGGQCVAPDFSVEDYFTATNDNTHSYWWRLQLPSELSESSDDDIDCDNGDEEPTTCCFDLDGDGEIDNGIGDLLGLVSTYLGDSEDPVDINAALQGAVDVGTVVLLMDYLEFNNPGDVEFSVLVGAFADEGTTASDIQMRRDGSGDYFVQESISFDEFGPQILFGNAQIAGDTLTAGPSNFSLVLPLGEFLSDFGIDLNLALTLRRARISAPVSVEESGVFTEDTTCTDEEGTFEMATGKLGGLVTVRELLDELDRGLVDICGAPSECMDGVDQRISWEYDFDGEALTVTCTAEANAALSSCSESESAICSNMSTVCQFAPTIGTIAAQIDAEACVASDSGETCDSDTCECTEGTDGIADSIGLGIRFSMAGADEFLRFGSSM
ncbi:MAG: hypothetical protein KC561_08355 [Myxococcales bacterium]|nr:hypothetical protein [Myxococcales bacterium]